MKKTTTTEQETLLKFPCEFPIKIIGNNNDQFEQEIQTILGKYFASKHDFSLQKKLSKNSKYRAFTLLFTAKSKAQIDKIYLALNQCKEVVMVL